MLPDFHEFVILTEEAQLKRNGSNNELIQNLIFITDVLEI
jgi:hypothetical protein